MPVNSTAEIQKGVTAGQTTWAGPLIMLVARSVLAVICQALVAAVFFRGSADAWEEAGQWWRVYGTVIDAGCIVLLVWLTRREGIRLFDLGNYSRERWLRDVLIGLGLLVPIFVLAFVLPGYIASFVIYGGPPPTPADSLPVVGLAYALMADHLGVCRRQRVFRLRPAAPRGAHRANVASCGCVVLLRRLAAQFPSLQAGMAAFRLSLCQQCSQCNCPVLAFPAPAPLVAHTRNPLGGECHRDHYAHAASGRGQLRAWHPG
jgi:hypothetical protein